MGNLCSKSSNQPASDPFAQPGRVLGSAPPKSANPRAQIPSSTTGGQKLGGAGPMEGGEGARAAAAKAAEERFAKTQQQPSGKLGKDLAAQKKMTRNDTLQSVSDNERRARDADASAQVQSYN